MLRLCWRKQVIVPNINVWPYIIIPCIPMYFCACLSKLLQAIFHFQAKYNEGCSRLLHITIDAVCSIIDTQSVCYSGATGCYTEFFFPHHAFCGLVLLKWKTLKSDVKLVYSQKSEQKWKKLVMQKNTLSMTAIEWILQTAFSFMIFIIGQRGDRTREKICGECYAMHDVMLLLNKATG